jgi:ADP-ribose pyrophosphatase YjhB (NUDIX family)
MITCTFENGNTASLRHVVVHMIVEKDGCLLLEKRAGPILETGKWSLPAGFLERGETAAECALRELKEETGWIGEVITLFKINTNPNRPKEDRQNVTIEFIVRPIKKVGEKDWESSKVEWIPFDKLLPFGEYAFDHGETIRQYLEYRDTKFLLPILV